MALFINSPSRANSVSAAPAFLSSVDKSRKAAGALEFTIHGIDFEARPHGFASHKPQLEGALARVQFMLAACTVDQLRDRALLDRVALAAVREETRAWLCWRRGGSDGKPLLEIRTGAPRRSRRS